MERFLEKPCDPKTLSPLTLAFVGDCVFELFVREKLVCDANQPVKALHRQSVQRVCCTAQAADCAVLQPLLTQEEIDVLHRGRNAHTNHLPKNASVAAYHAATGLECLFGYLYLQGKLERLRALFQVLDSEQAQA
ncbi:MULTISPECIES: Mini-ribonuclease 3 [Caproicibacterium]|uniref:Mini-ribonuclease 3 n=1 Tax=Caproicibacterium argilliputei TaxID=3030016 RepID=A0AA97DBE1_9FIRM|nr:ribonuclease III domain-containing protein [Caproicibacterium argilliputei]WOC33324.1 ribonuclease III domain-containing protein [Caproicibacterium argilliputei]